MAIYRIEHKNIKKNLSDDYCVGPYLNKLRFNKWMDSKNKHACTRNRPSPRNDKKLQKYFHYQCSLAHYHQEITENAFDKNFISGFKSIKDLKKWFSDNEIQKLSERGFVVKKYTSIKKQIIGEKSVMFIPNKAGKIVSF